MGRIEDALRRAHRGSTAADPDALDPQGEPEWLADPFDSPWKFEHGPENGERRPTADDRADVPPPVRRVEAGAARAPVPVDRPDPARHQTLPPPARPAAPAPGALRPEPSRRTLKPSVRLESQLAMQWPQPFAGDVADKLVLMRGTSRAAVEQYRRLAAAVRDAQPAGSASTLVVTSASPGEGKTLTAVNLALTLSEQSGERVLLIDADPRHGRIHQLFQVTAGVGLSECLQSEAGLPVTDLTANLSLLQRGTAPMAPEAFDSDRLRDLLAEAAGAYDRVIIDGPPAAAAAPLARAARVLLVANAGTAQAQISAAMDSIGRDRLLGVVRNRAR